MIDCDYDIIHLWLPLTIITLIEPIFQKPNGDESTGTKTYPFKITTEIGKKDSLNTTTVNIVLGNKASKKKKDVK